MSTVIYDPNNQTKEFIEIPENNDSWNLRFQIENIKQFIKNNESKFLGKEWICDIGISFQENENIAVYGAEMDEEFFKLMLNNRITIFLSLYPELKE